MQENTEALATDDAAADVKSDDDADNVGNALTADRPRPQHGGEMLLIYTLSGADAGSFRVGLTDGQIEVGAGTKLDYEAAKNVYMVTLTAEDSFGASASIMVTIMVTDMDEDPEITLGGLAISGPAGVSYAEKGTDPVATYTLAGPNAGTATWTLGGADASDFTFTGGVLSFRSSPNYENPADDDMDNEYMVTVMADDGTYMDTQDVTVTVTNVDEMGTVNAAPVFAEAMDERSVAENTAAGMAIGAPVAATDADNDTLTYTLGGDDMASFDIDSATGQLMTMAALDFETKTSYSVTVTASDDEDSATVMVTIMVTDVGLDNGYDVDDDGAISRAEAVNAVADFFGGQISREDALAVVAAFFG